MDLTISNINKLIGTFKIVGRDNIVYLNAPDLKECRPLVINAEGEVIVDERGYVKSPLACPSGSDCLGSKTASDGLGEALNYLANIGGGALLVLRPGTFRLMTPLEVNFNGPVEIDFKGSTLQARGLPLWHKQDDLTVGQIAPLLLGPRGRLALRNLKIVADGEQSDTFALAIGLGGSVKPSWNTEVIIEGIEVVNPRNLGIAIYGFREVEARDVKGLVRANLISLWKGELARVLIESVSFTLPQGVSGDDAISFNPEEKGEYEITIRRVLMDYSSVNCSNFTHIGNGIDFAGWGGQRYKILINGVLALYSNAIAVRYLYDTSYVELRAENVISYLAGYKGDGNPYGVEVTALESGVIELSNVKVVAPLRDGIYINVKRGRAQVVINDVEVIDAGGHGLRLSGGARYDVEIRRFETHNVHGAPLYID